MLYPATFTCPKCDFYWLEFVHDNKPVSCPRCKHKNIKSEDLD